MDFKFETVYNQEAVTVMAKALRKTMRKKKSRRSHMLGVIVVIFAILLTLPLDGKEFVLDFRTVITWIVSAILVLTLLFEDKINGYIARKRMLPGLDKSVVTFNEDGYLSETPVGKSEFKYDNIVMLAETAEYFIFIFSQNHAQVYDKRTLSGGTQEEFRQFIQNVTGKKIQSV